MSGASLAAPFALSALLALWMPRELTGTDNRLGFVLFVATAFSITAMPVLGRIMIEFKLTRTALGVVAISAAAINDVVGWLMLALVSALSVSAHSHCGLSASQRCALSPGGCCGRCSWGSYAGAWAPQRRQRRLARCQPR